jgi:hypothetical protein
MSDSNIAPLCNDCRYRVAEILQVNGDYGLHCWQEKTYADVKTMLYDRMSTFYL